MAEAGEDAEESLMKPPSPLNRKHIVTAEPCSQSMWSPSLEPVAVISYPGAASSYLSSSRRGQLVDPSILSDLVNLDFRVVNRASIQRCRGGGRWWRGTTRRCNARQRRGSARWCRDGPAVS
jgi:hypothetical protein